MTAICRVSLLALSTMFVATAGCSSENPPATNNAGNGGQGGASGASGSGAGGSTSGSSGTGAGGSSGSSGGSAGSAGTGTAGTGGGGSGGAAGTGSSGEFSPPCDLSRTVAGAEIAKGVVCAAADPQLCYKTCGPQSSGWKSETCTGGVYAEGDCQFPANGDYSCFKIPTAQHAMCPTDPAMTPQASQPCDVPECNACNTGGNYKTSSGEVKVGWCVCQPPNSAGKRSWTCASGTAWPCPLGQGC
jgi:hypothetical protein